MISVPAWGGIKQVETCRCCWMRMTVSMSGCGRSGGTQWHPVCVAPEPQWCRSLTLICWCHISPVTCTPRDKHDFFFFFFLQMRAKGKIIIIKKTLPSRRCLQRMCWMKEPPCVSLTCVHVSDWPCLGRPTQHHNSHDWVFSHCASQQTTAAHAAASADRLTVMPRWLDRDVVSSFCFFSPPPSFVVALPL